MQSAQTAQYLTVYSGAYKAMTFQWYCPKDSVGNKTSKTLCVAAAQGGYDDQAAHLIAFATTDDVFVLLWRSNSTSGGTDYLGHRLISMREVASESTLSTCISKA